MMRCEGERCFYLMFIYRRVTLIRDISRRIKAEFRGSHGGAGGIL